MKFDTYTKAQEILHRRSMVWNDLSILKDDMCSLNRLALLDMRGSDKPYRLSKMIPDDVFQAFRESAISRLEEQLDDLQRQFDEL